MKSIGHSLLRSGAVLVLLLLSVGPRGLETASAQECTDKSVCGEVSPLIPMQSTEAVHMGLVWKKGSQNPKILFHSRFPEYTPNDVADPAVVDAAIADGALTNGVNDFSRALRDVRHPSFRDGSDPHADSFQRLTYGGFLLRQGLSQSVPTRIVANRTMERQLLWDLNHADAFRNNGKFHTALLDEADFALNRPAFKEVGFSRGNYYNTYCNARVTLADGRVYVFGGHDMQSQNGLYKVNIFDPETETWVPRAKPCTVDNWRNDPFGAALFGTDPEARNYADCDQLDVRNTQPPDPSDGRYARWYPSAVPLPNNTVLIIGGTDQDASVGPDPLAAEKGMDDLPQQDAAFSATRINRSVPEIYDPVTDRHIALENAQMTFPLYPQAEVIQTGPRKDDWVVCTHSGVSLQSPQPGGDKFFGPFDKKTWCLDVLGALADPARETPAENHWTLLSEAARDRHYCCPTASLIETDKHGQTVSHRWYMFSGRERGTGGLTATIEEIEFTDPSPQWQVVGELLHPSTTSKTVVLPDGTILIGNGLFPAGATFEQRAGLRYQLFDPADNTTRPLGKTTVPRGLHGTVTLLPDATALFAGENREALVRSDDPSFPMAGFPVGDPDLGVPNGQIVKPPYLFNDDGTLAARPVISKAPGRIGYKNRFDIRVQGSSADIASVVMIRSDHNTHSLTTGDRYVKLSFEPKGNPAKGEIRIYTPAVPAQAVPGIYMLFVVNRDGVPSVGRRLDLPPA